MPAECRICRYQFSTGILGWDKHIGALDKHPNWHPELTTPAERQAQYAAEFPDFFQDALTADRRKAPQDRIPTPGKGIAVMRPGSYSGVEPSIPPAPAAPAVEGRCPTCGGPAAVHYRSTLPG